MKLICLLITLGFCNIVIAQNTTPSTVRQIFSLEKGDSLEYHTWTATLPGGCGLICNLYRLNIVDSTYYNNAHDTLTITFSTQTIYTDTLQLPANYCGYCVSHFQDQDYFSLVTGKWVLTNLDSTIKYLTDTIYGTTHAFSYDSTYINAEQYNSSKQSRYDYGSWIMSSFTEIYADSLGLVYKTESLETSPYYSEQLIYYHKHNGSTWGTPFVYTGIQNVANEYPV